LIVLWCLYIYVRLDRPMEDGGFLKDSSSE